MTRQYINNYLQTNQIPIQDSIDISNMDLLIEFAKISMGVACVIRSFVTAELAEGSLVEVPLEIPIHKREVGFVYKAQQKTTGALEEFIYFYETFHPNPENFSDMAAKNPGS